MDEKNKEILYDINVDWWVWKIIIVIYPFYFLFYNASLATYDDPFRPSLSQTFIGTSLSHQLICTPFGTTLKISNKSLALMV